MEVGMARYEVFIPARPGTTQDSVRTVVEAETWLVALRMGMERMGEGASDLSAVMCETGANGVLWVKDPLSKRVFCLTPLDEPGAQPAATEAVPADADDTLADLFMETCEWGELDRGAACEKALDLALKTVHAEAGSVILTDPDSAAAEMTFVAARGRVAKQLLGLHLPRGRGIVGFSVVYGCVLAVANVHENPHFYREVSRKTGFETRSILCVPIRDEARVFGAIELVNKEASNRFLPHEINALRFLASQLGGYLAALPAQDSSLER